MKFRLVLSAVLGFSALTAARSQAATVDAAAPADLLRAADTGDVTLLKSAIKRGAPLEVRDSQFHFTPLAWAAWKGNLRAVDTLLAAGANIEAYSAGASNIPVTINFLGEVGRGEENGEQFPLALAALSDSPQSVAVVRNLLKHGANPNSRNSSEMTPFLYAIMKGKTESAEAMLASGGDPNMRVARNIFSPLSAATLRTEGEASDLVKHILAAGANPIDSFLGYPLPYLARRLKRIRTAELIENAQKHRIEEQKRIAAQPAIIHPDSSDVPTFLD